MAPAQGNEHGTQKDAPIVPLTWSTKCLKQFTSSFNGPISPDSAAQKQFVYTRELFLCTESATFLCTESDQFLCTDTKIFVYRFEHIFVYQMHAGAKRSFYCVRNARICETTMMESKSPRRPTPQRVNGRSRATLCFRRVSPLSEREMLMIVVSRP